MTYTAQWSQDKYTVTYAPGAQGTFEAQETGDLTHGVATPAFAGETIGNPGYSFTGWSPEVSDTVTRTVTYTAQWSGTLYTITYAKGEHGTFDDQVTTDLTHGVATPAFDGTPVGEPGYSFFGWEPAVKEKVDGDQIYVAQWFGNDTLAYQVEYYYNGKLGDTVKVTDGLTLDGVINSYEEKNVVGGEQYQLVRTENFPLTITEVATDNVIRVYYESKQIEHDPEAAVQVEHFYYRNGTLENGDPILSSLSKAQPGDQIYINNSKMPEAQVVSPIPRYDGNRYTLDGSKVVVRRAGLTYQLVFRGNGAIDVVPDPINAVYRQAEGLTIPDLSEMDLDGVIWVPSESRELAEQALQLIDGGLASGMDDSNLLAVVLEHLGAVEGKDFFLPGGAYTLTTAENLELFAYRYGELTLAQLQAQLAKLRVKIPEKLHSLDAQVYGGSMASMLRNAFRSRAARVAELKTELYAIEEMIDLYADSLNLAEEMKGRKLQDEAFEVLEDWISHWEKLRDEIAKLQNGDYLDSGYQDSGKASTDTENSYRDSGKPSSGESTGGDVGESIQPTSWMQGLFGGLKIARMADVSTEESWVDDLLGITSLESFLFEKGYTYTITLTYNRTTGGGGTGGGDGGDDGGDNDYTTIPDNPVPLASSPDLVTILDEEVPLGKLPTSGSNRNAHRAGGAALMALLLGLLAKSGHRKEEQDGSDGGESGNQE